MSIEIWLTLGVLAVFIGLLVLLDRRTKRKGSIGWSMLAPKPGDPEIRINGFAMSTPPQTGKVLSGSGNIKRLVIRWVLILGACAAVLYAAFWIYTHPGNPIANIGVWVFAVIVGFLITFRVIFIRVRTRPRQSQLTSEVDQHPTE